MTTVVRRTPSPLAHGPHVDCPSCRDCPSCDGGRAHLPTQYRVEQRATTSAGIHLVPICTRCVRGVICPNLTPDPKEPT